MGEEEAFLGIVRVGIALGVFVVHSMVSRPVPDASLVGHRGEEHEQDAEGKRGAVGAVRPESVAASGDSQQCDRPEDDGEHESVSGAARNDVEEGKESREMDQAYVRTRCPIYLHSNLSKESI